MTVFNNMPANRSKSARSRLSRLKRGLPRHKIALRSGGAVPKNPFFARAGGHTMGGPIPGGRATRGIAALVGIAITLVCGRWYYGQKVNIGGQVERVLRSQYLPQLEKQIGAKIEIGAVETDLLGRVTVHDVVVGRDARLPIGALARISSVTVGLDLPGLVLRRVAIPDAIRSVVLNEPQIYLHRDSTGLNWAKMLAKGGQGPKVQWTGTVTAHNGRIYYIDSAVSSASKKPLLLDAQGMEAAVDAVANSPYRFVASVARPYFGANRLLLNQVSSDGAIQADLKRGLVGVNATAIPLSPLGDFAFPKRDVLLRGGSASGKIELTLEGSNLSPHGALTVQGGALTLNKVFEPNSRRPITVDGLSGPVLFAGQAFSTTGASFKTLGADFSVAGAASLGDNQNKNPVLDMDLASNALPVARLRTYLPASAQETDFSSGAAKLNVHLSGTSNQVTATGALDTSATRLSNAKRGLRANFQLLHTVFAASTDGTLSPKADNLHWRFAARMSATGGAVTTPQGQIEAKDWVVNARGAQTGGLEVDLKTLGFNLKMPHYGASRGAGLFLTASTPDVAKPDWRGSANLQNAGTDGLNLAALSPQVARLVRKSGELNLNANFSGLKDSFSPSTLQTDATFSLSGLQLNEAAFGKTDAMPLHGDDFNLSAIRGRLSLKNGLLNVSRASAVSSFGEMRLDAAVPFQSPNLARVALSVPRAQVSAARFAPFLRAQNVALTGDWRGRVSLLSDANQKGKIGLDFDLQSDDSILNGLGPRGAKVRLQAPRLQGRADFDANHPAQGWNAGATLTSREASLKSGTLGRFAALPPTVSGARAVGLHLNLVAQAGKAVSSGTPPLVWSGDLSSDRVSAPLPLAGHADTFVTLTAATVHLEPQTGGLAVSRFGADLGNGRILGTASVVNGQPSAQLLVRNVEAGGIQRLVAPASLASARLTGITDATLQIKPGVSPSAQIRFTEGAVKLSPANGDTTVPLDGARANVTFDKSGTLAITDALLWSDGARISGGATLAPTHWSGKFSTSGLSIGRMATLPFAKSLEEGARPDGLASGDFTFQADPRRLSDISISGQANLKLGTIMGAAIDSASAQVEAHNSAAGWNLALTNLQGQAEDAPFTGELHADLAANTWKVKFETKKVESGRLTRLRALQAFGGTGTRNEILDRALPVDGSLSANIELTGTLKNSGGNFSVRPSDGFARVTSGPLSWRGRPFGTLLADIQVEKGVANAKTLSLLRLVGPTGQNVPSISVTGELPLDLESRTLNAKLVVAEAPLAFFTELLKEGRDALVQSGISAPFYERAVSYVDQLPSGTTGRAALEADITGAWHAPRVHVTNLTLRDGRTRIPAGGYSPPATLDAAFTFENNAVAVEKAEFKIKKTAPADASTETPNDQTKPTPAVDNSDDDDDTLLRVEPGGSAVPDGPIVLSADVFNANLSQLSTWVPALRGLDGGPLLRGQLSEFSFRVGGTTIDPVITGSIQAESLAYNAYTIDRLRVARFEVGNGSARVEPGNLTIVKGAFQSSAAYGKVPWSWSPPGPVRTAPMDLHFPMQTKDFGALVGAVVPSLTVADADEFSGSVDVMGTMEAPQLSGAITIRGGQFRLDPKQDAFQTGITNLSGTVRFEGGNELIIDADDPLKGKLVSASAVVGRIARRDEPVGDGTTRKAAAAGGPDPKTGSAKASPDKGTSKKKESFDAPTLGGEWILRGSVTRAATLDTAVFSDPTSALARLRYDLSFSLDNGQYSSNEFAGIQDVSLGMVWKTGPGERPELEQNVRWMAAASGVKARKLKTGGSLSSFGSLTLRPDFGAGIDALARSSANDFSGEADFSAFPVFKRIDFKKFPDRRAQLVLDNFATGLTGAASGVLDGRLVLDNRPTVQQAPSEAVRLQNASITGRGVHPSLFGRSFVSTGFSPLPRPVQNDVSDEGTGSELLEIQGDINRPRRDRALATALASPPLRLGGTLTLDNAEIYGAPAGSEGTALLLSRLPSAPIFDIKLEMGKDVQIVTAAFRAGLGGYMVASGSPADPQILGTLETRDGQVRFPNARARVEEGRVTIALNRDPATDGLRTRVEIDATARGQAGRYAITLRLRGPLDLGSNSTQNLKIDVSSNPPLSQNEAFEQLLGTVPNSEGSTNQAYASSVLSVLSAPLFSGVENTLAQTLGLTSIALDYRFNEPIAVELTKAIGDRVFISYRRTIGNNEGTVTGNNTGRTPFELRIEYRLKGNYLLGLQTDERRIPEVTIQKSLQF